MSSAEIKTKLIAIAGALKGMTFALPEGEVSIGREASNGVCLNDPSVSRRHCVITKEADQLKIIDLDSFNGTFINGVPVKEQPLKHGDQIAIGDILLLFLAHEGQAETEASPVQLDERNLSTRSTIRLQREDAFYLHPEKVLAALPSTARVARDLNVLLKISTVINSVRSMELLQRQLLELILDVIPAERGAIILFGDDSADHLSGFGWNKRTRQSEPMRVSQTIISQVFQERVSILANDIVADEALGAAKSLVESQISSLLCVPLMVFEKMLGVIYLDTSDAVIRFDESNLELLTATASIAAVSLEKAAHVERLEGENKRLRQELDIEHKMIGESQQMREVYQFIAKAAPTDSTVLIRGESGTGKELAARALHINSSRAQKPFVAINCATLTDSLLESELFGHEKGAFTGAIAQKLGKLEAAEGGTIFLDEIGELALNIQAKLLRVLQEREFERVGSTRPIKINVRIVAATNKNLEEAVSSGSFRQDLYYRLNVLSFVMPPLRERREDIPLLAGYFAAEHSKRAKRRIMRVSAEARSYLMDYDWPGNVRELENVIERAVVLGSTDLILPEDLPENMLETVTARGLAITKFYDAVRETKKQLIIDAVHQAKGNYAEAARLLGLHPNNLHRLIRNMNLKASLNK